MREQAWGCRDTSAEHHPPVDPFEEIALFSIIWLFSEQTCMALRPAPPEGMKTVALARPAGGDLWGRRPPAGRTVPPATNNAPGSEWCPWVPACAGTTASAESYAKSFGQYLNAMAELFSEQTCMALRPAPPERMKTARQAPSGAPC